MDGTGLWQLFCATGQPMVWLAMRQAEERSAGTAARPAEERVTDASGDARAGAARGGL